MTVAVFPRCRYCRSPILARVVPVIFLNTNNFLWLVVAGRHGRFCCIPLGFATLVRLNSNSAAVAVATIDAAAASVVGGAGGSLWLHFSR